VLIEDGGQTWDRATVGVPPGRLGAVDFADARNGRAVGTTPASCCEGGPPIMHTSVGCEAEIRLVPAFRPATAATHQSLRGCG